MCILSVISFFFDVLDYLSEGACVKQSNSKLTVYTEINSISRCYFLVYEHIKNSKLTYIFLEMSILQWYLTDIINILSSDIRCIFFLQIGDSPPALKRWYVIDTIYFVVFLFHFEMPFPLQWHMSNIFFFPDISSLAAQNLNIFC